jgi:hypothetical protein
MDWNESANKGSENEGSSDSYELSLLPIHVLCVKGSDLLAHRTRIMYRNKRYTMIRN